MLTQEMKCHNASQYRRAWPSLRLLARWGGFYPLVLVHGVLPSCPCSCGFFPVVLVLGSNYCLQPSTCWAEVSIGAARHMSTQCFSKVLRSFGFVPRSEALSAVPTLPNVVSKIILPLRMRLWTNKCLMSRISHIPVQTWTEH